MFAIVNVCTKTCVRSNSPIARFKCFERGEPATCNKEIIVRRLRFCQVLVRDCFFWVSNLPGCILSASPWCWFGKERKVTEKTDTRQKDLSQVLYGIDAVGAFASG